MIRTATATLAAALCLGAALPVSASAADPGLGGGTAAPQGGGTAVAGTGSTLRAARGALLGRWQRIGGTLAGAPTGLSLLIQRSDGRSGWVTVARAHTGRAGGFSTSWRPDRVGHQTLRAIPAAGAAAVRSAGAPPTAPTTVYASAMATEFGPGFFGRRAACGALLQPGTIGVAHTQLPCGTLVEFYYRGRTIRAPVIDRGPYANGASWDLTTAAARALGFDGRSYVGSLVVGRVSLRRG